ncbi:MAG TPA: fluoride efflux transporter CrcB [Gammaproteobacteria bacterium]|jgi:CrcB protein|nr:fluoride efflux transporter CrcB [Gammaproteobacteria bacterium]HIK77643.1 fluoride efflux transporter CrcB [Gammaproteobacteria bacterium]
MNELIKTSLLIAGGGFIGTLLRFLTTQFINKYTVISFPIGTVVVNLIGCLLIGVLAGFFSERLTSDSNLFLFLTIGCLGGFTTFSAFAIESQVFIQNGEFLKLAAYISIQVLIGIMLAVLGYNWMRS